MAPAHDLFVRSVSAGVALHARAGPQVTRQARPSAAIAAGALILAGIAGWATPSTAIGAQIDTFGMMASAKDLPTEEFQDISFVFLGAYR